MKKRANKKLTQKIIIIILIVLSFNFVAPTYSRASFGGVLMGPVIDLFAGIGDAVLSALQYFMYDGNLIVSDTGSIGKTLTNPFNSFLLTVGDNRDELKATLEKYGTEPNMSPPSPDENNVDIVIDSAEFDKGWLSWLPGALGDKSYGLPIIRYTPEEIFSNNVPALDVNFINPKDWEEEGMNEKSITQQLHSIIANWYIALRNLGIVALLSVLLYVGIRMVISSSTSDKAKYKQMLIDWLIALCILFFLHYIMSFVLTITEMITDGLDSANNMTVYIRDSENGDFTYKTDLTGICRLQVQYADFGARMIYLIFYIALVVYTLMFTWTYVKRAITMAFLTLMAPLISITYPIDKIGDGKAQAFGIWIREFIFNALLQPFHLIVYTIFLGSATQIAVENPVYAILFLAFITPAEKLLRKMFGFNKSETAGGLNTAAGMFGGAAAFKMMNNVLGRGKGSSSKSSGGQNKLRTKNTITDKNEIGKDLSVFAGPSRGIANSNIIDDDINNNSGTSVPNVSQANSSEEINSLRAELDNADYNDMFMNPGRYIEKQERLEALERQQRQSASPIRENRTQQLQAEQIGNVNDINQDNVNDNEANRWYQSGPQWYRNMNNGRLKSALGVGGRAIKGIGNVGKEGAKFTGEKLKHRFASREGWKENARFVARTAVKGTSAAMIGAVGLGMGIAGDDLEDVLTYGVAGATLGGTVVGNRLSDAGGRVMHSANMAFQDGYYGDHNAAVMAQQHREYFTNEENRNYFEDEFEVKGKDLDEIMHRAADINNQGITDNKAIKQTIKLENSIKKQMEASGMEEDESARIAKEQAITIAKIADNYNTEKLRTDDKYVKGVYKDFENGIKNVNPEISNKDLKAQSEQMMKLLRKYKKID